MLKKKLISKYLIPSIIGFSLFYYIPYLFALYYSFTENMSTKEWTFFANYQTLLSSDLLRFSLMQSLVFFILGLCITVLLSFLLATVLQNKPYSFLFLSLLIISALVPAGSISSFWLACFAKNGYLSQFFHLFTGVYADFTKGAISFYSLLIIFIFRSIGLVTITFFIGIRNIPKNYYDFSSLEGAGKLQTFFHITLPGIIPSLFSSAAIALFSYFRSFRDFYLLLGSFPSKESYMIQFLLQAEFAKGNFVSIAAMSFIFLLSLLAIFFIARIIYGLVRRIGGII